MNKNEKLKEKMSARDGELKRKKEIRDQQTPSHCRPIG